MDGWWLVGENDVNQESPVQKDKCDPSPDRGWGPGLEGIASPARKTRRRVQLSAGRNEKGKRKRRVEKEDSEASGKKKTFCGKAPTS